MKTLREPIHDRPHGWLAASLFLVLCGPLWGADLDLEVIGSWPLSARGRAQAVAVSGSHAYVATSGAGLQVIDISDPLNPTCVARDDLADSAYDAYDVAVSGNVAYVTEGLSGGETNWARLQLIDISDPANPHRAGACSVNVGATLEVAVVGNHAYLASDVDGFQVIDVSSPASPQRVGGATNFSSATAVAVSGHHAYVIGKWWETTHWVWGLHVMDITNPTNPERVGHLDGSYGDLAVSGSYAYVAGIWLEGTNRLLGLQVIDISNPADPRGVGRRQGAAGKLAVSDGWALVSCGEEPDSGFDVIDISDPAHPQRVGWGDTSVRDVVVLGHRAYVVADWYCSDWYTRAYGLQVIDVSDPAHPQPMGSHDTGARPRTVAVSGHFAYVADGCYGLQVIDVANPADPELVGSCATVGDVYDVVVVGRYAYLAAYDAGLQVVDISSPARPVRIGGCRTSRPACKVSVSGNYACVLEPWWDDSAGRNRDRLQVIDISDPAKPQPVGTFETGGYARDVAVSGNHAYVFAARYTGSNWVDSLQVIDITNPADLQQIAS